MRNALKPHCVSLKGRPALLARPGLVSAYQFAVERARAEDYVVLARAYRLDELGSLRDRHREVCVEEGRDVVARFEQPRADGVAFAPVRLDAYDAPFGAAARVRGDGLFGDAYGVVLRAVVNDDDLSARRLLIEVREDFAQRLRDARRLVVSGDYDGER
jgi:hypothetical protein